ncbi:nuclear transport factor 2 family protein [Streptomyces sp. NPDC006173]|uniref:nuclear transport factor 2 family protein n=1 Tax=Streptomyces sp. NPDC006173 TaxID=3155349 RepID=UPI0033FD40CE
MDRRLNEDGTFTDQSIPDTYRGAHELGKTIEVCSKAFPDMHHELGQFYTAGNMVIVQLRLQGTHSARSNCPQARPADRQAHGRPMLRSVRTRRRQHQALRLLRRRLRRRHPTRPA